MTDIISTARAAGVHPLAMSEEYLPGLQRFAAVFQEIERLALNGIHSCHAECQRPVCRLTQERNALLEALKRMASIIDKMGDMPDGFIHPSPWQTLKCEEALTQARAAIKAVEGEKT